MSLVLRDLRPYVASGFVLCLIGGVQAAKLPDNFCHDISSTARLIMKLRQSGTEKPELIKKIEEYVAGEGEKEVAERVRYFARKYVVEAYNFPLVYDGAMKKEAEVRFGNQMFLQCYHSNG